MRFLRNNEATDIDYQLQMTTDLANPAMWQDVASPAGAPLTPLETIEQSFPVNPLAGSVFYRVRYEQTP